MNAETMPAWKLALRNAMEREHAAEMRALLERIGNILERLESLLGPMEMTMPLGESIPQDIRALLAKIEAEVKMDEDLMAPPATSPGAGR